VMQDIPASSAIYTPAGFSEAEELSQIIQKILAEPQMVEFIRKHGGEPIPSTPSALKKDIASQLGSWERAVEAAGLTYKK
jgi:tripartite-type tricarboxylate transporter receptor subunit TctC